MKAGPSTLQGYVKVLLRASTLRHTEATMKVRPSLTPNQEIMERSCLKSRCLCIASALRELSPGCLCTPLLPSHPFTQQHAWPAPSSCSSEIWPPPTEVFSPFSSTFSEQAYKSSHLSLYCVSIKALNVRLSPAQKVTPNKKPAAINEPFVIWEGFSLIIVCLEWYPLRTCANLLRGRTFLCHWFHLLVEESTHFTRFGDVKSQANENQTFEASVGKGHGSHLQTHAKTIKRLAKKF